MLEHEMHQIMAEETARLRAAPDLAERVIRASRRRNARRLGIAAVAAAAAVVGITVPAYLVLDTTPARPGPAATSGTTGPDTADQSAPQPLFTQLPPPVSTPTATPRISRPPIDIGSGNTVGRVHVGYMPEGLVRDVWAANLGDQYTAAWHYPDDGEGTYRIQIYVFEGLAVAATDKSWRGYQDKGTAKTVSLGAGRTGLISTQWVGEDGGKGTPTAFVRVGEERVVEVLMSPDYAKDLGGERAIDRELTRVAAGLTADD
ncbi:hypothetical protein [Streptosporangium sp. NBC_01469]|uniref:hypothetical protein n=1 Tax=Streptosporangium sp. NBC_01469 TaxID=2903898 RepID=UPI002E299730|nr:hypothetical protein [Streptosporangium sp. NBC_01469]